MVGFFAFRMSVTLLCKLFVISLYKKRAYVDTPMSYEIQEFFSCCFVWGNFIRGGRFCSSFGFFFFFSERRNGCVGKNLHQQPHHHQVITWCLAASASLLVLKVVFFVFHPELEGLEALLPALYSLSPMEQVN